MLSRIMSADIKFLKYLLEAGADPNIQSSNGQTALHKAVSYGHMNKVKLLLKYKAGMYIKDKWGKTPFDLSLLCGYYNIAELFISAGYVLPSYVPSEEDMQKVKNHRLLGAVWDDDLPAVKKAIADGANVKGNPLLLRTNIKDINVLRYLLENGMSPNIHNDYRWSLLHSMSYMGTVDSIKILLEFGADMTVKEKWNETPFGTALGWWKYDIAELFVLNGYVPSDEDFTDIGGNTETEQVKTHLMTLVSQVQEHKEKFTEETKNASQEFVYADEVMEM